MLALAVLDRILSIDRQNQWLVYVCNSGYLRSLVESLRQDDVALQGLLTPQPPVLKPLYLYESKMVRLALKVAAYLEGFLVLSHRRLSMSGSADPRGEDFPGRRGAAALWPDGSADGVSGV